MSSDTRTVAGRMLALAEQRGSDPAVAYLCVWTAAEVLISSLAWEAGVRPSFSLRQNGTLRTQKVDGLKVPQVVPPPEDHLMRTALKRLPASARRQLVAHPSARALAQRVPTIDGTPVRRDSFRQRLTGVMDLALTRDARYPVWHGINLDAVDACLRAGGSRHVGVDLLWQIALVLRTIGDNLKLDASDDDEGLATSGLPLVRILVEGWLE